ncbi:hypothetical protein RRG08_013066 [Elysia crispata]|uniref:Uncharacterized protein n=1 Tax=Elysia crispata TaxID=231223 RepID=A0AAE1DRA8_9GAST|nr:hypothetical protein RRG08_013066 [Elysia crispata]
MSLWGTVPGLFNPQENVITLYPPAEFRFLYPPGGEIVGTKTRRPEISPLTRDHGTRSLRSTLPKPGGLAFHPAVEAQSKESDGKLCCFSIGLLVRKLGSTSNSLVLLIHDLLYSSTAQVDSRLVLPAYVKPQMTPALCSSLSFGVQRDYHPGVWLS